jgi:hypothetical protein
MPIIPGAVGDQITLYNIAIQDRENLTGKDPFDLTLYTILCQLSSGVQQYSLNNKCNQIDEGSDKYERAAQVLRNLFEKFNADMAKLDREYHHQATLNPLEVENQWIQHTTKSNENLEKASRHEEMLDQQRVNEDLVIQRFNILKNHLEGWEGDEDDLQNIDSEQLSQGRLVEDSEGDESNQSEVEKYLSTEFGRLFKFRFDTLQSQLSQLSGNVEKSDIVGITAYMLNENYKKMMDIFKLWYPDQLECESCSKKALATLLLEIYAIVPFPEIPNMKDTDTRRWLCTRNPKRELKLWLEYADDKVVEEDSIVHTPRSNEEYEEQNLYEETIDQRFYNVVLRGQELKDDILYDDLVQITPDVLIENYGLVLNIEEPWDQLNCPTCSKKSLAILLYQLRHIWREPEGLDFGKMSTYNDLLLHPLLNGDQTDNFGAIAYWLEYHRGELLATHLGLRDSEQLELEIEGRFASLEKSEELNDVTNITHRVLEAN